MTAENQEKADERLPLLVQVPAAVRFVRNKGDAKASTLYDIAKALNCRMEDFF